MVSFLSGKREERNYEGGVLTGPAVVYGTDGDKFEFTYVEGKIQGMTTYENLLISNTSCLFFEGSFAYY